MVRKETGGSTGTCSGCTPAGLSGGAQSHLIFVLIIVSVMVNGATAGKTCTCIALL